MINEKGHSEKNEDKHLLHSTKFELNRHAYTHTRTQL